MSFNLCFYTSLPIRGLSPEKGEYSRNIALFFREGGLKGVESPCYSENLKEAGLYREWAMTSHYCHSDLAEASMPYGRIGVSEKSRSFGRFGMIRSGATANSLWFCILILLCAACTPPEPTWVEEEGYRWSELKVEDGEAGFNRLSPSKTGVEFVNHLSGEQIAENRHRMHGSGVALGDIDGDGWTDIYLARLDGDNALYRNKGEWRFEDVTESSGVAAANRFATGVVFADIDGDEDLDLLVTAMDGPNAAFLNDGTGHFTESTEAIGFQAHQGSTSMAIADIDGDEDLDIYVANYKNKALRDSLPPNLIAWDRVVRKTGEQTYDIHPDFKDDYYLNIRGTKILRFESAEEDFVFVNEGNGTFQRFRASTMFSSGKSAPLMSESGFRDWALAVRLQDFNGDGSPDLYVCNDFESPDYVMLNDGSGKFYPVSPLELRKTSNATMSVAFSDINHDGHTDFFPCGHVEYRLFAPAESKEHQRPIAC